MTDQESAAEHLRTIRALMERATIYRAISGPAALFGGILALAVGMIMGVQALRPDHAPIGPRTFFLTWICILAATGISNILLLRRGSQQRHEPFLSSGMKLALRAILPPMLAGGVISWLTLETGGSLALCALLWVVFYSLALLASANFAPRSMRDLGRMFFAAGLALLLALHYLAPHLRDPLSIDQVQAGLIMTLTFGTLHLLYAFKVICRPDGEQR